MQVQDAIVAEERRRLADLEHQNRQLRTQLQEAEKRANGVCVCELAHLFYSF